MVAKQVGDKYRCTIYGNEVTLTKIGRCALVCCGKPMGKIEN